MSTETIKQAEPSLADVYRELLSKYPEHAEGLKVDLQRKANKKLQA